MTCKHEIYGLSQKNQIQLILKVLSNRLNLKMVWAHDVKKCRWCGEVFDEKCQNLSMNNFLIIRWCTKPPTDSGSYSANVKRLNKAKTPKITNYLKK